MKYASLLEPGETVLLLARRHSATFWPSFLLLLLMAGLPSGFAAGYLAHAGIVHGAAWRFVAGGSIVWIGFWLARAIRARFQFERDVWIVTERRVVEASASSLVSRTVTSVSLEDILDVKAAAGGLLGTLLGYGDVTCRTTAEGTVIEFIQVPRPHQTAALLLQQSQRVRRSVVERPVGDAAFSFEALRTNRQTERL